MVLINQDEALAFVETFFLFTMELAVSFRGQGHGNAWDDVIYPGMKKAIICALLSTQDVIEYRKVPPSCLLILYIGVGYLAVIITVNWV